MGLQGARNYRNGVETEPPILYEKQVKLEEEGKTESEMFLLLVPVTTRGPPHASTMNWCYFSNAF